MKTRFTPIPSTTPNSVKLDNFTLANIPHWRIGGSSNWMLTCRVHWCTVELVLGCSIPLTVWMLICAFFFLETEYRDTSHHIIITVLTALIWPTFHVLVLDPFSWARNSSSRMEDSSCRLYQEVEPNSSIIFQLPWINSVDCYWLGRNYCNMRFDFQRPI